MVDPDWGEGYIGALMDLSIVIPAYNEERRIGLTLEKTAGFLESRPWKWELIAIDDGSSDRTSDEVLRLSRRWPGIRCLRNERNRGKGYSVRRGVETAEGRYVGFMDADYKTDIACLDAAVAKLEEGWDGVIGDRRLGGTRIAQARRAYRQIGSEVFKHLLRVLIGLKEFGDTQCGFKFFQAPVAQDLFARQRVDGYMFDVEILLLAVRSGYRICPIPVVWSDDPDSRFKPLSGSVRDMAELFRIFWRHRMRS